MSKQTFQSIKGKLDFGHIEINGSFYNSWRFISEILKIGVTVDKSLDNGDIIIIKDIWGKRHKINII